MQQWIGTGFITVAQASHISFEQAARHYIEAHRAGWKNTKHVAQWTSTLEAYAYSAIQSKEQGAINILMVKITG